MKQLLISEDFFPPGIEINREDIFPMIVMATMSSGKSTLINALLGEQLLPCKNEACTAKKFSILDDDKKTEYEVFVTYKNGSTRVFNRNIRDKIEEINEDINVSEVLIRGHINGVLNSDRSLLVIDTPGPNNSRDDTHSKITEATLKKVSGGLILYVLNATQFGINDDKSLLQDLKQFCCSNLGTELLFVINKIDQLDEERGEQVDNLILDVKEYLEKNGFPNANIIPVSSLAALVFKKVLNHEELTRLEKKIFDVNYELFRPEEHDLRTYAILKENDDQLDYIRVGDEEFRIGCIKQAIERTGISLIEEFIQKAQIQSGYQSNNDITIHY